MARNTILNPDAAHPVDADGGPASKNAPPDSALAECADAAILEKPEAFGERRRSWEDPCASVLRGDLAAVRAHLARGLRVDLRCDEGFTLVELAAAHGHGPVVEALLAAGARPAGLHAAVAGGDPAVVRALLAAGADVDATDGAGFTPLLQAVAAGLPEVVRVLLAHGADVSREVGDTGPLALARRAGDPRLAGLLRQRGARS